MINLDKFMNSILLENDNKLFLLLV